MHDNNSRSTIHNRSKEGQMKRLTILLAVFALIVGAIASSDVQAAGRGAIVKTYNDYGTITHKLTLDGDSATSCGVDYRSDSAVFTPWVNVPVLTDYLIYIEQRDADSAKAFGPDTVHVGLFTTTKGSFAADSASFFRRQNTQVQLWDYGSLNWRTFNQQTYFQVAHADTNSLDTLATAAASNKSTATGGKTQMKNLGLLRFGLTMDDSDSLLDSGVRFNCYIVFKDPTGGRASWSDISNGDDMSYANIAPLDQVDVKVIVEKIRAREESERGMYAVVSESDWNVGYHRKVGN